MHVEAYRKHIAARDPHMYSNILRHMKSLFSPSPSPSPSPSSSTSSTSSSLPTTNKEDSQEASKVEMTTQDSDPPTDPSEESSSEGGGGSGAMLYVAIGGAVFGAGLLVLLGVCLVRYRRKQAALREEHEKAQVIKTVKMFHKFHRNVDVDEIASRSGVRRESVMSIMSDVNDPSSLRRPSINSPRRPSVNSPRRPSLMSGTPSSHGHKKHHKGKKHHKRGHSRGQSADYVSLIGAVTPSSPGSSRSSVSSKHHSRNLSSESGHLVVQAPSSSRGVSGGSPPRRVVSHSRTSQDGEDASFARTSTANSRHLGIH